MKELHFNLDGVHEGDKKPGETEHAILRNGTEPCGIFCKMLKHGMDILSLQYMARSTHK